MKKLVNERIFEEVGKGMSFQCKNSSENDFLEEKEIVCVDPKEEISLF